MKLTERTSIPITWVMAAYIPTTGFVLAIAFWVFKTDARLARIEQRLMITTEVTFVHRSPSGEIDD